MEKSQGRFISDIESDIYRRQNIRYKVMKSLKNQENEGVQTNSPIYIYVLTNYQCCIKKEGKNRTATNILLNDSCEL